MKSFTTLTLRCETFSRMLEISKICGNYSGFVNFNKINALLEKH